MVITNTPKKLNTVASNIAPRGLKDLVEMQVAIALGASVQPFTSMTDMVNRLVTKSAGIVNICCKNSTNETSILLFLPPYRFSMPS